MDVIAHIFTDFPNKFGVPRQSGIVNSLNAKIVFEPEYNIKEAFRGLEDFSHIWLLWQFSESVGKEWSPTVRPPRLGGNKRMGVFATRSPFRPNNIGLSCVKLERIEQDAKLGTVLIVSGADLINGTPIFDIKPYLPYTDSHPNAVYGFAEDVVGYKLKVVFPDELLKRIPENKQKAIVEVLSEDPRPAVQSERNKVFGMNFAGFDIKFTVENDTLTVCDVVEKF